MSALFVDNSLLPGYETRQETVGRQVGNKLVSSARDQDLAQHPCGQLNLLAKPNWLDHFCTKLKLAASETLVLGYS